MTPEETKQMRAQKIACEKILYGNRPYSMAEIHTAIYE
jgi:hypothetical protein